ncbi:hypothetical protein KJ966_30345 [bacterium]|nr:hypothetical protein [bacterium]
MTRKTLKFTLFILSFVISATLSAQSIKIGFAWAGKSGMADRVTNGFDNRIKEIGSNLDIEYVKNLPDINKLGEVIDRFQKSKTGMVILRSNGAEYLGKNQPKIPTFIGGCNHPAQLGTVQNLMNPEGNITGVTYFLPVETQFEIFTTLLPNMKSLVLLANKNNPSSSVDLSETQQMCAKMGFKCVYELTTNKNQVFDAVNKYKNEYSAFVIGNQAEVMDVTEQIVSLAGKVPVLSYSSIPVKKGALGGFVADDFKLGMLLADSVVDVLVKGKSIKSVSIKVDPKPKFFINTKTAEMLGIEIPFEILELAELVQ